MPKVGIPVVEVGIPVAAVGLIPEGGPALGFFEGSKELMFIQSNTLEDQNLKKKHVEKFTEFEFLFIYFY